MTFAEMTNPDRAAYFNFHGQMLLTERANFVAALERWASTLKRCDAFENNSTTAAKFVSDALDSLDGAVAEEVVDYLGAG